jgi:multiple sugar transport system substrate-binding protein
MFSEQFPYAHVRPKVAFYPEASKALQLALQEALTKQKSPQQALDDAAAKWTSLIK